MTPSAQPHTTSYMRDRLPREFALGMMEGFYEVMQRLGWATGEASDLVSSRFHLDPLPTEEQHGDVSEVSGGLQRQPFRRGTCMVGSRAHSTRIWELLC